MHSTHAVSTLLGRFCGIKGRACDRPEGWQTGGQTALQLQRWARSGCKQRITNPLRPALQDFAPLGKPRHTQAEGMVVPPQKLSRRA